LFFSQLLSSALTPILSARLLEKESIRYTVILELEEDGSFHVWCPASKGCHLQGETQEEALANIQEAVALYVESLQKEGKKRA
jgi:predicted RNase H-like HicB family nuclease